MRRLSMRSSLNEEPQEPLKYRACSPFQELAFNHPHLSCLSYDDQMYSQYESSSTKASLWPRQTICHQMYFRLWFACLMVLGFETYGCISTTAFCISMLSLCTIFFFSPIVLTDNWYGWQIMRSFLSLDYPNVKKNRGQSDTADDFTLWNCQYMIDSIEKLK